jgi:hypothetical protein
MKAPSVADRVNPGAATLAHPVNPRLSPDQGAALVFVWGV